MAEVSLENAPRKARELLEKGRAAMERNNWDYAMDMFMSALELEPRFLQARKYLRLAGIKKFQEKKGGSLTHTVTSITGAIPMMLASSKIQKNPLQALQAMERVMRQDPLNLSFLATYVKAAEAADLPEAAIMTLEAAREFYPQNLMILETLGRLYQKVERMHDARLCYEEIAKLRPNDPKAIKDLKDAAALDTMQRGGWNEATSYRDVIKDSGEALILEQESKAVKSDKDLDALISEMKKRLDREPENINYVRSLADLLVRANRFDEAVQLLQDAVTTIARGDPQLERTISAIKEKKFDYEIEQLEASGSKEAAEAKRKEKSRFMLADAADRVKRYPNDLQFRYEYGVLLYEQGQINEAIQQFQMAQRNPQRRTRALLYLASCFKQKKQYDIALEQLEKAASELRVMDDTKKDILYEMGTVYELVGHREKAAQCFKEIYAVDIAYRDVAEKVEKGYTENKSGQV
jgi:tetratricopeptide (TPR) repeat protein